MEKLESFKKRLNAIEELSSRLENGELSIDELVTLETLTRELYERTVILKYKAFENKVNPIVEGPLNINDEMDFIENTVEYEIEPIEPTIEFSIFDAPEDISAISIDSSTTITDEVKTIEVEHNYEKETVVLQLEDDEETEEEVIESITPEVVQEIVTEIIVQEEAIVVEAPAVGSNIAQGQSFWEQLNINNNSLSTQFEGAKLDTLVGAFGLNEKLRFINDLFDGSSESFSEAIKILDTQSNLETAKVKSAELALKHGWNAEEESVVDFLIMVNRRYA